MHRRPASMKRRIRHPLRLRRHIKGRHTEPQTIIERIGHRRQFDPPHTERPRPQRGLHGGAGGFRRAFGPEHLIAFRHRRLGHTFDLDTDQLFLGLEGVFFVLDRLDHPPGLATRMAVHPGPLHGLGHDRIGPPPAHTLDPFPEHVHPDAIRWSIGEEALRDADLEQLALLILDDHLDKRLDAAGVEELPDHDAERQDPEGHEGQRQAFPAPGAMLRPVIAALNLPVGLVDALPFVTLKRRRMVPVRHTSLRGECLWFHRRYLLTREDAPRMTELIVSSPRAPLATPEVSVLAESARETPLPAITAARWGMTQLSMAKMTLAMPQIMAL